MAANNAISADRARQLLDYDPDTGVLTWKARTPDMFPHGKRRTSEEECRRWNSRHAGKVAGGMGPKGYLTVAIEGIRYRQHRICWLIATGQWPAEDIDHRHGIRSNNRLSELREATNAENHQNQKLREDNTSGHTGVFWHAKGQKWMARINAAGRSIYLGLFSVKDDAIKAYLDAKAELHPFQPIPR